MFVSSPNAIMISSNELTSEDYKMVDIKPKTLDPITESNKRDEVKEDSFTVNKSPNSEIKLVNFKKTSKLPLKPKMDQMVDHCYHSKCMGYWKLNYPKHLKQVNDQEVNGNFSRNSSLFGD